MSKSRGNVVNPDEIVERYGADAFRLYEMFMGPLEQVKPWSTRGVEGTHRFLNRAWRLLVGGDDGAQTARRRRRYVDRRFGADARASARILHQTIAKVTDDIEALRFNTAIAALMELTNAANKWPTLPRRVAEQFALLLARFAPHLAEELWQPPRPRRIARASTPWPAAEPRYLVSDMIEIPVQVNGKMRGKIEVSRPRRKRKPSRARARRRKSGASSWGQGPSSARSTCAGAS